MNKINKMEWKIYFLLFIFGHASIYGWVGSSFNLNSIKSIASLIVFILSTVAFFCFAWNKKTFNQLLWKAIFIFGVLWKISLFISFVILIISNNLLNQLSFSFLALILLDLTLTIFAFTALYFYAFQKKK